MPKKKNFLGGQQNYNPNNGQYEPALKGPNGESPKGFSSFSKDKDESFDAINKKRMGKETELTGSDLVDEFQDRLQSLSNDYNVGLQDDESTIGELKKIKADLENNKDKLSEEQYKSLSEEVDRQIGAGSSEEPKGSTQYFKHPEVDGVWHDTGKTIERNGNTYKVYENEQGKTWAVSDKFAKQFQPFDKDKKTELLSKDYLDKFYELSGGDEDKMLDLIRKDPAYQNNDADPNDTWSMGDLEGVVGAYFEKRSSQNKNNDEDALKMLKWGGNFTDDEWEKVKANENWVKGYLEGKYTPKEIKAALKAENETNSFEETNAKRIGKEQPKSEETTKSYKSADRKDKYGNPLVSDEVFKVGQKAAKEYLEESLKYNSLDSLKKSNVFLGYMQDKISRAIEDAELNPDYDMTYDDFNEIMGSVIGEEIDLEEYEGNATKGWTGRKYSGYDPSKTENHKYNSLDEVIKEWNSVLDSATKMSNDEFMAKYDELRKEFDRLGGNKKK